MAMNLAFQQYLLDNGNPITYIGLLDTGVELTGGSPAYARLAVTWTSADASAIIRPNADLTFDVPAGSDVTEWRGYSAVTAGTDYGGETLTTESFASQGQYKLLAASTGIDLNAV